MPADADAGEADGLRDASADAGACTAEPLARGCPCDPSGDHCRVGLSCCDVSDPRAGQPLFTCTRPTDSAGTCPVPEVCSGQLCPLGQRCCSLTGQCYPPYEFLCGTGECGGPCAAGLECLGCRSGESGHHSLCSSGCRTDSDCTDPARPHCNHYQQRDPGFCTPTDFWCCWFCI